MVIDFIDRALQHKCAICSTPLRKNRIALYSARVNSWDITRGHDNRNVKVYVCGEKCLSLYRKGVVAT